MKKPSLTGQKFGRLTVLERVVTRGPSQWFVRCDCGRPKMVSGQKLKSGKAQSCGKCELPAEAAR